jgi:hypothetical protein
MILSFKDSTGGESEMWRAIVRSLKAALRAMARLVNGVWTSVFGGGGEDVVIIDDDDGLPAAPLPAEKAVGNPAHADHDLRTALRRDAALIYTYAAKCQIDCVRPEMPACLSRAVRAWLPGLTTHDLMALTDAGQDEIRSHISGGPYIMGVHRVQALPPVKLERLPERDPLEGTALWQILDPRPVPQIQDLPRAS